MHSVSHPSEALTIEGDRLVTRDGLVVLEGLDPRFTASPTALDATHGMVLACSSGETTHAADVLLGKIPCSRFLACARKKLWWMIPEWGVSARDMPPETQFLLAEMDGGAGYALFLPLLDGAFRGTLRPPGKSDRDDRVTLRIESGDRSVKASSWDNTVLIAYGSDPFALVDSGVATAARLSGSGKPLSDKEVPALLDSFGWCTWDAFYSRVSASGVADGVSSLAGEGLPPRFVIIDDGWQQTDVDSDFRTPPPQRVVDGATERAARVMEKMPDMPEMEKKMAMVKDKVAVTSEQYSVAESKMLAKIGSQIPASSSAGTFMPALSAQGPRKEHLHRRRSSRDGSLDGIVEPDLITEPEEAEPQNEEERNITFLASAYNTAAGWLAGVGSALFIKFYQWVIEPSAHDSWQTRAFTAACQGFMRTTMLTLYADASDFTRRLTSVKANAKFSSPDAHPDLGWNEAPEDLRSVVESLKSKFGVKYIYCWHGLPAYWSGVMSPEQAPEMAKYDVHMAVGEPTDSLLEIEPSMGWNPSVLAGIGVLRDPAPLYKDMHEYLLGAGVDGVKVDCQAGVGLVGSTMGGGPACAQRYHKALEASIVTHFPGNNCINCMCHSTENLYHFTDTAVARASDDFYPRDKASSTPHIAACAYNSMFLGAIVQPDWDMFHSVHEAADLHAVARAVSGGAVYVSDKPGRHDLDLLRTLVLPDGSVLRCKLPARPTLDCLFLDVLRDNTSLLKVHNMNACSGVVAAFNLQGASWNRSKRAFHTHQTTPPALHTQVYAGDVPTLRQLSCGVFVMYVRSSGSLTVVEDDTVGLRVDVGPRAADVVTIVPAREVGGVTFAPVGLTEMVNCGGAVLEWVSKAVAGGNGSGGGAGVEHRLDTKGAGSMMLYCSQRPTWVKVDGEEVDFEYEEGSGGVLFEVRVKLSDLTDLLHTVEVLCV